MVARLTGGQKVVGSNPVIPIMVTFLVTLGIFTAVFMVCTFRVSRSDRPIAKPLRRLMYSVYFPIAANVIIVLAQTPLLANIGYALYFIGTNWMLYLMMGFSTEYCNYHTYKGSFGNKLLFVQCLLDSIMVILNPVFGHVFTLRKTVLEGGRIYYTYDSCWYHYIHLVLTYLIVATLIVMFIVKLAQTSYLYTERYLSIELSILVVAAWDGYYILTKMPIDYSMISYVAMAMLVYFFTMEYKPFIATYRMLSEVTTNISEGIVFFDEKNVCIYTNHRAKEMLGYTTERAENAWDELMSVIAGEGYDVEDVTKEGYFQCVRKYEYNDMIYTFEMEFQQVLDRRGRYTGAFVSVKDRTEEQRKLDEERYAATHDRLTGLYNADYLYSRIEKRLREDPDTRYIVVTSDIKGFKMVNDIYGTRTGDDILINIGKIISEAASEDTIYGRINGDKFGLMMRRDRYREEVFTKDMNQATISNPDMFYPIIIHVGVYEITDRRIPVSVMFDRAFMALATIKEDMQKRVAYYDSNLREDLLWEQRVAGSIDVGLDTEQIIPYMQAQVTSDGQIQGVELLARWMHPTEGFLKPRRFLPTLEKNGYVVRLDQYMWERACKIIKRWEDRGWDNLYLSVNISPVDFFFIDVVEAFKELVSKYDVDPGKLRLEITENAMMYDANSRIEAIERLREAGFVVEMDDFGNGYSSLNMLKDIPIDVIKIDMAFLEESRNPERAKQILETMIALAKKLTIPIITEGVETSEQVRYLTEMGCDMFQGFFFAKAVPVEEFEDRYIRQGNCRINKEF